MDGICGFSEREFFRVLKMRNKKSLQKGFVLQQDVSDCGVVCLQNILKYYDAEISLEKLREWSGTTRQGASLLGLNRVRRTGMQGVNIIQLFFIRAQVSN